MKVRVRYDGYMDTHVVEYKKWYHLSWKVYKCKYLLESAIKIANSLKHPIITEIE
jgi:hypothetical protein